MSRFSLNVFVDTYEVPPANGTRDVNSIKVIRKALTDLGSQLWSEPSVYRVFLSCEEDLYNDE